MAGFRDQQQRSDVGWSDLGVRARRITAAAAAAALLAGGCGAYVWIKEQTPGARLAEACGGMLPVDEVLALTGTTASGFGGNDLDLSSNTYDVSPTVVEPDGLATVCQANDLSVQIESASGSRDPLGHYVFQRLDGPLPVPLPGGWSGFLVPDESGLPAYGDDYGKLGTSVLLDCPAWDRRHGSGILVTARLTDSDTADPAVRRGLVRIATGAAERAAQATGCDGDPGGRIGEVGSTNATAEHLPADRADGTCEGVTSQPWVLETAARTAPTESCVLEGSLVLRSYYGPFVRDHSEARYGEWDEATGATNFGAWGSADCGGALGDAVYMAELVEDSDRGLIDTPLTRSEHADLRTFAEASAKRHGCRPPEISTEPPVPAEPPD
ncbi:hypothetical protein [Streptomonospora wellingtoniae]|uniref:Uncharacterized protein n=1 Tax=Streptomonospora wellingtoniae TaxID=3075544 RepID=A0ABU2L0K2_9ACTN|nr:hypothetical protein [Streptomonospora sp. DSM 45055]MDT0305037.1 hypothetical protein [Streptomonospora sp. DSM 45055]